MNQVKTMLRESYGKTTAEYIKQTNSIILDNLMQEFQQIVPTGHILDIGCANGRDMLEFESRGYQTSGLEITPEFVDIAEERVKGNVYLHDIVEKGSPVTNVDGIWSIGVYHHFPFDSIINTTKNIRSALKPKGSVCISTKKGSGEVIEPDERYGGVNKYWSYYSELDLKHIFRTAGFRNVDVYEDGIWLTLFAN